MAEAITSVVVGTSPPAQIIVALDAVGAAAEADHRAVERVFQKAAGEIPTEFRHLHTEGLGPAGARNRAAALARDSVEWLAFLDSDDLWSSDKLAAQHAYLAKRPHLDGCQTLERWEKSERVIPQPARLRPRPGRFLKAALEHCLISPSSVILRRRVFEELGGFDESYPACEDFELWLRWLRTRPMGLVPRELTIKRAGGWPQQSREVPTLDYHRIRAILKLVRTSELRLDEYQAAEAACRRKLAILNQGAARRGRPDEYQGLAREIDLIFRRD